MKSQLKTSYLHRQEGKIKPKNYMKKLINQNKVILTTKYINYTNYEVSLKNTLYLHRLRGYDKYCILIHA